VSEAVPTSCDVLVIGAGAAGGSSSRSSRCRRPSRCSAGKRCGSPGETLRWWHGGFCSAVVPVFARTSRRAGDREVDFSWCLKDPVVAELPGDAPFWIVRRERLDQLLAEHAVEAGAEHYRGVAVHRVERHGNHWEVSASDGLQWCSRAVVIADGSGSPWPQQLGLGPKHVQMASTMSVRLEGQGQLADGTTRFEFGLVKQGFAWAFPIAGGVNIGVGSFIGKQDADPDAVLSELLPDLGFEASAGIRQRGQLRVWNGHHRLDGDGVVVVGDAASLCDPFLAEGLRPALMSGCEAAHHLDLWLKGEQTNLRGYSQAMRRRWGDSMAWGRRIAQVFYRFPGVGYQLGIKRPTAPQRIAQILSGEMGYGDIAQRVIKRLLLQRS